MSLQIARPRPKNSLFRTGTNYLYDDELFAQIAGLAQAGRIHCLLLNITDGHHRAELVAALRCGGRTLSVVDISNCWDRAWAGQSIWTTLVDQLAPSACDRTILMGTVHAQVGFVPFGSNFGACKTPEQRQALASWLSRVESEGTTMDLQEIERLNAHLD